MNIFILYLTRELDKGDNTFPFRAYSSPEDAHLNAKLLSTREEAVHVSVCMANCQGAIQGDEVHVVTKFGSKPNPVAAFGDKIQARNFSKSLSGLYSLNIDTVSLH